MMKSFREPYKSEKVFHTRVQLDQLTTDGEWSMLADEAA
jgi:hypothetical protein